MDFGIKELARADLEAQGAILGFDGPTRFLSNFAWSDVCMYGITFPTVEHAFAAAKLDPNGGVHPRHEALAEMKVIAAAEGPNDAKRLGRRRQWNGRPFMRKDWDAQKENLVLELIRRKFTDPALRAKLLATGDALLYELNTWGDDIWGVVEKGGILRGRNMLGEMLMFVRAEIRAQMASAA
jgi:ribA/ribD-fused uncharacterized protein